MLLKPSLTLVFDVDERIAGKETILEIKRCYPYIGTPVVHTHAPENEEAPISNTVQMIVAFGARKYLYSTDEEADENWSQWVENWIGNMLWKIGNNMMYFNKRQRKIGLPEVVVDNFDIVLQGGAYTISLHPNLLSYLDDELTSLVSLCRDLLNDGTFADAVRVRVPADEAYQKQAAAWRPKWDAEHPEPEPEPEEEAKEEEYVPERNFESQEWLEYDIEQKSYENTAVPPTDSDELPNFEREEEVEPPEPFSFDVDYVIWEVIFKDGTSRFYNSETFEFIDEVPDVPVVPFEVPEEAEAESAPEGEAAQQTAASADDNATWDQVSQ